MQTQTLINQGRQVATLTTNTLDALAALNTAYVEAGGAEALNTTFEDPAYQGDISAAYFAALMVTVQALLALRAAGHGTNLAKVRG